MMKKLLDHIIYFLSTCPLLFSVFQVAAQSPGAINYQAVARDGSGNPIANTAIYVEFKIWKTDPTIIGGGSVVYDETHNVTTNAYGLFNLIIASGSIVSGNFPTIPWGSDLHFLEVLVDPDAAGGLPYVSMGATQFISVPYSLHSNTADSLLNPPAGSFIWKRTADSVYLNTLSNRVGIGTNAPSGKLSVLVPSGSNDGFNLEHQGTGHAAVFYQSNAANDSDAVISYTKGKGAAMFGINIGTGHGGVFAVNNPSSSGIGLVGSNDGNGKAVFGYQTGLGYGGAFWINNVANDSAAVIGLTYGDGPAVQGLAGGNGPAGLFQIAVPASTDTALIASTVGMGKAGYFEISNPGNSSSALYAITNGTGLAGEFIGRVKIFDGTQGANKILTSDASGNASWQTLPASVNIWSRTAPNTYLTNNGDSVGIGVSAPAAKLHVVKTGGTSLAAFITSGSSGDALSVSATNSSGGRAGAFQNTASSNTAEVLNVSALGSGGAIVASTSNNIGAAIMATTTGNSNNAGYFQINNAGNTSSALYAKTTGTGLAGEFVGKIKTTDFQMTNGGALNSILTSDAAGNASWQTPSTAFGGTFWTTSGNVLTGTLPASPNEWIGSSIGADLIFKTSNVERMRVASGGGISVSGNLSASGSGTFGTGLTASGGAISLNDNSTTNTTSIGGGTTTGAVTIGGTGVQTLSIGNGAAAKTVNIGSSNTTSTTTILSGSGGININTTNTGPVNIGTGATVQTILIGTGTGNKSMTIGSSNTTSTTNIQSGSGGVNINSNIGNPISINGGTSTGQVNIGTGASTQSLMLGTGAGAKTVAMGSTNTTSSTAIQAGSGGVTVSTLSGTAGIVTNTAAGLLGTTATVPIANGGTGASTATTAINNLLPAQTGNSGKFLTTDGSNASWGIVGGTLSGGTINYIPKWTGATSLSSTSNIFDDGTNVGIGTASPSYPFHVQKSAANVFVASIENTNATGYGLEVRTTSASSSQNAFEIFTGGTSRFLVRSDGYAGLGTIAPEAMLHIRRTAGAGTSPLQLGNANQPIREWLFDVDASANMSIGNEGGGTPFTSMFFGNTGNVGIGTTNPTQLLSLSKSMGTAQVVFIQMQNAGADGGMLGSVGTTSNHPNVANESVVLKSAGNTDLVLGAGDFGSSTAGNIRMQTYVNGTGWFERLTILNNGNVGIGTTTPGEKLDVSGNIRFSNLLMPNGSAGTAGDVLTSQGIGAAPIWQTPPITGAPGGGMPAGAFGNTLRFGAGTWVADNTIYNDGTSVGVGITSGFNGIFHVKQTGSGTNAGYFEINNASNGNAAVLGTTNSASGNAGYFSSTNNTSSANALYASNNGSGNSLLAANSGTGTAVYGSNTGTGYAGYFQISNPSNNMNALFATTNGPGAAITASNTYNGASALRDGIRVTVSGTGGSTNTAGYFSASGSTNNYAGIFDQGNVGIGTTAPTSKLHVALTTASLGVAGRIDYTTTTTDGSGVNAGLRINANANGTVAQHGVYSQAISGSTGTAIGVGAYATGNTGSKRGLDVGAMGSGTNIGLFVDASGGATNYAAIFNSGDVGIGTIPTAKLDVAGQVKIADGTEGIGKVLTSDNTGLASWQSPAFTNAAVYNTNGNFTVPAGVTKILVEVWGAGGGGGVNAVDNGGGGGGGAYAKDFLSVVPAAVIPVTVGIGGVGAGAGGGLGGGGTSSSISTITANGGAGGATSAGGAGGAAGAALITVAGGGGYNGLNVATTFPHGGDAGVGGTGGRFLSTIAGGSNGVAPGGGGSGANGGFAGGTGANGRVIVWW